MVIQHYCTYILLGLFVFMYFKAGSLYHLKCILHSSNESEDSNSPVFIL